MVKTLYIQTIIYNRKGLLLEMMRTRSPERIPIQSPKERKAEVHIKYFVTINKSKGVTFEKQINLLRVKRLFLLFQKTTHRESLIVMVVVACRNANSHRFYVIRYRYRDTH